MLAKPKVVLFYPPYDGPPLSAPLCLLSLASPLLEAGFDVRIVDAAIVPDWESRVLREVQDALCLGVSVLTGPMIRGAIRIGKLVKDNKPDVPVIFGGWHPSLMPGHTLNERYVDAVVRGQGELTLLEIAQRLAENKPFNDVQGVSSKPFGLTQHSPERRTALLDDLPMPVDREPVADRGRDGRPDTLHRGQVGFGGCGDRVQGAELAGERAWCPCPTEPSEGVAKGTTVLHVASAGSAALP